jgi:hypothetical protein
VRVFRRFLMMFMWAPGNANPRKHVVCLAPDDEELSPPGLMGTTSTGIAGDQGTRLELKKWRCREVGSDNSDPRMERVRAQVAT